VLKISVTRVLKVLKSGTYVINSQENRYDCLETDEFWTYAREMKNKVRLIYAYHRESGEIAAYVRGKRDIKTAEKLRKRIKEPGISYDRVVRTTGRAFWRSLEKTGMWRERRIRWGLRGNCRLRHRVRRAFRRTCCFSKTLENHRKAFEMAFFYINYGFV
jgi:IS1 family transposase